MLSVGGHVKEGDVGGKQSTVGSEVCETGVECMLCLLREPRDLFCFVM